MRFAFGVFATAALLALAAALLPTPLVEAWALWLFPTWARLTTWLYGLWPWSLTLSLAAALLTLLVLSLLRPGRRWRRALVALVAATGLLGIAFVLSWGAAYHRTSLAERLDLPRAGADLVTLQRAFERLVEEVHAYAPATPLLELDRAARRERTGAAARCVADLDAAISGRPVAVPSGVRELPPGALLRAGYGGVSLPWLLEPHVDGGLPGAAYLAVAAHELMHTAGWAREADTDALSVLAGLSCPDAHVRYALALHGAQLLAASIAGVTHAGHPLRATVREALLGMPESALADRRAMADAIAHYRIEAAAATVGRAYDAYLRAQGVEAGIADYGLAGALLAAALGRCEGDQAPIWPWCEPQEATGEGSGGGPRLRSINASTSGSRPMKSRKS